MDQNKNAKMVWGVVIVVAIIVIIGLAVRSNNMKKNAVDNTANTTEVEGTEDTTGTTATTTGTGAASVSYQQALITYKDRRIQLGAGQICTATPNNVTYKNGTSIMIDNRSPQARTIKLGTNYTIKGYGFRIITLNSSTLPATWYLDCGTQQNVATILIQK